MLQEGCILHIIINEFEAGLLQKSHLVSKGAKAKVTGFRDGFKDVLIIWILRDKVVK